MNTIEVPDHVRVLGEEAERLRDLLDEALASDAPAHHQPPFINFATAAEGMAQRLTHILGGIDKLFNGPIAEHAQRDADQCDRATVYRTMGRLEQLLLELVDAWRAARDLEVSAEEFCPRSMFVDGLQDLIEQLSLALGLLSEVITCPEIHVDHRENGMAYATANIQIRPPLQFKALTRWWMYKSNLHKYYRNNHREFWNSMGLLALGRLLCGRMFGNVDE